MTGRGVLGVGMLGAGPVVQAIHLPTLARLTDRFAVTHVMDVSAEVAEATALRVGATASTSTETLLADPAVEVVAICSPSRFHAEQVIAAMRSGKRAVLCEKPFAETRSEAEAIAAVSAETGVPVLVGAMHAYDPAFIAAAEAWGDLPATAHTIRSHITLPPNERFEDFATEVENRIPPPERSGPLSAEQREQGIVSGVLGLAIHDLPLIRRFLPEWQNVRVRSAAGLSPFGYGITLTAGDRGVLLAAAFNRHWRPRWELEVIGDTSSLHIEFTPSYVQAGSAVATVRSADGVSRVFGPYPYNGYEGEWRTLHRMACGDRAGAPELSSLINDVTFAI
ncbi:MAG: Gfo/Idh/MocA family protein, partial [Mycetocola sp.]